MRYLDLADALRARVAEGQVGPGGALPSEAELARAYKTSRVTVRSLSLPARQTRMTSG